MDRSSLSCFQAGQLKYGTMFLNPSHNQIVMCRRWHKTRRLNSPSQCFNCRYIVCPFYPFNQTWTLRYHMFHGRENRKIAGLRIGVGLLTCRLPRVFTKTTSRLSKTYMYTFVVGKKSEKLKFESFTSSLCRTYVLWITDFNFHLLIHGWRQLTKITRKWEKKTRD